MLCPVCKDVQFTAVVCLLIKAVSEVCSKHARISHPQMLCWQCRWILTDQLTLNAMWRENGKVLVTSVDPEQVRMRPGAWRVSWSLLCLR